MDSNESSNVDKVDSNDKDTKVDLSRHEDSMANSTTKMKTKTTEHEKAQMKKKRVQNEAYHNASFQNLVAASGGAAKLGDFPDLEDFAVDSEDDETKDTKDDDDFDVSNLSGPITTSRNGVHTTVSGGITKRRDITFDDNINTKVRRQEIEKEIDRVNRAMGINKLKVDLWILQTEGGAPWKKAIRVEVQKEWKLKDGDDPDDISEPEGDTRGGKEQNEGSKKDLAVRLRKSMRTQRNDSLTIHKHLEEKYGISSHHKKIRQCIHDYYHERMMSRSRAHGCTEELVKILRADPIPLKQEDASKGLEYSSKKLKQKRATDDE